MLFLRKNRRRDVLLGNQFHKLDEKYTTQTRKNGTVHKCTAYYYGIFTTSKTKLVPVLVFHSNDCFGKRFEKINQIFKGKINKKAGKVPKINLERTQMDTLWKVGR